jgi:hypothetical protein
MGSHTSIRLERYREAVRIVESSIYPEIEDGPVEGFR